jgi:hypothetical protein
MGISTLVIDDHYSRDVRCAAANQFLRENAASHPPPDVDADVAYAVLHQNFSPYLDSVEWLTQRDCDIDDAVASMTRT